MPTPPPVNWQSARSDLEAKERFKGLLQKALSAVHPTAQWYIMPVPDKHGRHSAYFVPDVWISLLRADRTRVYLRSTITFEYEASDERGVGERKVRTCSYAHTLADALTGPEICSWQWHEGEWPHPHLHVGKGREGFSSVARLHLPTSRVAFEQVALFAITDCGVEPACVDARRKLEDLLDDFVKYRSWHTHQG